MIYSVKINGVDFEPSTLTITENFEQFASVGELLIVFNATDIFDIQEFHVIEVFLGVDLIFKGIITRVMEQPRERLADVHRVSVKFIDNSWYAQALYTRIALENITVRDALVKIIEERLQVEYPFITVGDIDLIDGTITKLVANYEKVSQTFDKIASNYQCYWRINDDYSVDFKLKSSLTSVGDIDMTKVIKVQSDKKINKLRTRQHSKGGLGETDEQTESFQGDGVQQTFTVGFAIARKPRLFLSSTLPPNDPGDEIDPATIGVRGIDDADPSIEWLFTFNSPLISRKGTLTPITDKLTAKYIGLFQITQITDASAQQDSIATKVGGTGVVEALDVDETVGSLADAQQKNLALLRDFSNPEFKYPFATKEDILELGNVFTVPGLIGSSFLLTEKVTKVTNCTLVDFIYTGYDGAYYGGWKDYFKPKPETREFAINENEVVSFIEAVDETTNWSESVLAVPELQTFPVEPGNVYNSIAQYYVQGSALDLYVRGE